MESASPTKNGPQASELQPQALTVGAGGAAERARGSGAVADLATDAGEVGLVMATLASNFLFAVLDEEERRELARGMERYEHPRGGG